MKNQLLINKLNRWETIKEVCISLAAERKRLAFIEQEKRNKLSINLTKRG